MRPQAHTPREPAGQRRDRFTETSAILASAQDRVVSEVVASLERRDQAHHDAFSPEQRRRDVRHLFGLVLWCVHECSAESIITPSRQIAPDRFAAGADLAVVQVLTDYQPLGAQVYERIQRLRREAYDSSD